MTAGGDFEDPGINVCQVGKGRQKFKFLLSHGVNDNTALQGVDAWPVLEAIKHIIETRCQKWPTGIVLIYVTFKSWGHNSWSSLTQQLGNEMETHKQVQFINTNKSTSNQIILLASAYQQRVIALNREIERKKQEIRRLKELIADRHAELLSAHHPVTMPSKQLMSTWLEVQDVKTTLTELQTMCKEEAAQKVRLCKQIQHLNQQLELQSEQQSKDLQFMSKRIERSKVLVQQFDDRVGRGYDEAALKNVLELLKETSEFEQKMFQESMAQVYDQNVATLIALQSSDQILLEHEMSENQQLHQCIGLLREEITALRSKLPSNSAEPCLLVSLETADNKVWSYSGFTETTEEVNSSNNRKTGMTATKQSQMQLTKERHSESL
ncbi:uncharacterized protein LOC109920250 [Rhincodon typus]|uniref:uncharacterized protein LOC109920250 n=1 Tax=Rhincodon typus TaxID=259920 RepID=UPI00202DC883|nr:uncharacterized protein LOC109920250 [Rhincodon typus]